MTFPPLRVLSLWGAALVGVGCTGSIDSSSNRPGAPATGGGNPGVSNPGQPGGGNPGSPPPSQIPAMPNAGSFDDGATVPGTSAVRRLTRVEFANTVRDLLGVPGDDVANALASDVDSAQSGFFRGGTVSTSSDARAFMTGAEKLGQLAGPKLSGIVPCAGSAAPADQDSCADQFIQKFGRRAFRRPLAAEEATNLRDLYKAQRTAGDSFEDAMTGLITAVLQAPQFLYRWELGPSPVTKDGQLARFNNWEVASRLSYLFWASMPDDQLLTTAEAGGLTSPEQIANQARRLLTDPKAKDVVKDFFMQWLELGNIAEMQKDPALKDFSPEVAKSMMEETRQFVANLFFGAKADGKLATLITSNETMVNAGLAKLYGLPAGGADMKPATLDPTQRAGIFTQAAFLTVNADASTSHPVHRGDEVLRRLLCVELVVPADLVVPPLPDPKPGQTTRELFSAHSQNPCATCHKILDPVGFTFENYDAIGAWRTMEVGKPIDSTGTVSLPSGSISAKNAVDLMKQLASTKEARECMTTQWMRYMLRRRELPSEDPSFKAALKVFGDSGLDMRELMVALTRTKTFTHRALSAGEVSQ